MQYVFFVGCKIKFVTKWLAFAAGPPIMDVTISAVDRNKYLDPKVYFVSTLGVGRSRMIPISNYLNVFKYIYI